MRVLHVVTWDAPGNPFGGPLTVAKNLSAGLQAQGHDSIVIAARPGGRPNTSFAERVSHFRGFRLIPKAGFSGLVSPGLLWSILRKAHDFDVVHVHVCRDLISLPAAYIAQTRRTKVVLQPHGMVDSSSKLSARLLDRLLTRRVFRCAHAVLALTAAEREDIAAAVHIEPTKIAILPNGVPEALAKVPTNVVEPEFLFCSRLQRRKNPSMFAEVAATLLAAGLTARFTVAGPDEGELEEVDRIVRNANHPHLKLERALGPSEVLNRLRAADVLVLPSVNEPYPMIVLEAMSVGLPVIITDSCGLAGFVNQHQAGVVIQSGHVAPLAEAITRLAGDQLFRCTLGARGRNAVREVLSIENAISSLLHIYQNTKSTHEPE